MIGSNDIAKNKYIGQVDLNIFVGYTYVLPVVRVNEKYCINLVKIFSKSVDWFKSIQVQLPKSFDWVEVLFISCMHEGQIL